MPAIFGSILACKTISNSADRAERVAVEQKRVETEMTNSGDKEVSDKERTAERKGNRTEDRRQQRQRGSWRKRVL